MIYLCFIKKKEYTMQFWFPNRKQFMQIGIAKLDSYTYSIMTLISNIFNLQLFNNNIMNLINKAI